MPRFKATIAYDGTPYHGWQIQPNRPTVQGTLATALHHLTGQNTLPQGAGRTDTGVHALAQVAHFDVSTPIPTANLHRALNRSLPPSIRILTLDPAAPDFHARHHARHKTYEYRILPRPADRESICPPTLAPYVWPCPRPLSLDCLNQAAAQILGTHDFTSFAAVNPDQATRSVEEPKSAVSGPGSPAPAPEEPALQRIDTSPRLTFQSLAEARQPALTSSSPCTSKTAPETHPAHNSRTIHSSLWTLDQTGNPPLLRYRVTGTGFLHHMVRNLVGTFTDNHRYPPQSIPLILAARDRQAAGPTAPPQGLFLAEVAY